MMILFWLPFIAIGAWLISRSKGLGLRREGGRALDILDERYARGEISPEEYRRMKQELAD